MVPTQTKRPKAPESEPAQSRSEAPLPAMRTVHSDLDGRGAASWAAPSESVFRFVTGDETLETDARRAAGTDSPVLIIGESGTGRSSLARLIHGQSRRSSARFTEVDCRVADPDRLEKQFEEALASTGGTVLLSGVERGLPILGASLKRFLEGGLRRLPSASLQSGGPRLILEADQDVRNHLDRALWQRLVAWPPLLLAPLRVQRRRKWSLFRLFVEEIASVSGQESPLAANFLVYAHVVSYGWAGNVRQLRSFARHLVGIGALAERCLKLDSEFSFFDESEAFAYEDTAAALSFAKEGQTVFKNRSQRNFVRALAWLQGSVSGPQWRELSKASPGADGRWTYGDVRWNDPHFAGAEMCAGVGQAIDTALTQQGQWNDRLNARELLFDPNFLPWTDGSEVRRMIPGQSELQLADRVAYALLTGEIQNSPEFLERVHEAVQRMSPDLSEAELKRLALARIPGRSTRKRTKKQAR